MDPRARKRLEVVEVSIKSHVRCTFNMLSTYVLYVTCMGKVIVFT